jgi:hypothetical protein
MEIHSHIQIRFCNKSVWLSVSSIVGAAEGRESAAGGKLTGVRHLGHMAGRLCTRRFLPQTLQRVSIMARHCS